jgi:hypothetical protein
LPWKRISSGVNGQLISGTEYFDLFADNCANYGSFDFGDLNQRSALTIVAEVWEGKRQVEEW